jgi:hypothetical protein
MRRTKVQVLKCVVALASLTLPVTINHALANGYNFTASEDKIYVATTGEVLLTFLSKTAVYSNDLFLTGSNSVIFNNQTTAPQSQFSLGTFQAGQELSFDLFVHESGYTYHMGNASTNADNFLHVAYDQSSKSPLIIGFEDLYHGGDKDYDDFVFSITNVATVPEPGNVAMLLAGLGLFGLSAARKKRNEEVSN